MAEGDQSDDDLPGGHNPLDNINQIILMHMRPQHVINAVIIDGGVRRTLPPIRIPRHFTVVNPGLFVNFVRRALTNFSQHPLGGPPNNPLLSRRILNADYWSVTLDSSGEGLAVGFFPVYINTPPETSESESSTDDEQPGPSDLDSNSEARAGESSTSSSSMDDEQPGPSDLDSNSEARAGGSSTSSSSMDDEQPGPSNLVNNISEDSSGGSGSQVKKTQGVKRKREHGRSESRKSKRRQSDHNFSTMNRSSTDDEQPGPSNRFSSSKARAGRSDHWSDSDSSHHSISSGFSSPGDNEQPEPSHKDDNEVRTERSRTPSDQSSVSQKMKQGGKRKRKTSGRSESGGRKRSRLEHRSDSASNDDQTGPSDQSSSIQIKMRQGIKRKRQASVRSESREWKRWRSDHRSDSESDSLSSGFSSPGSPGETSGDDEQPKPSDRENSEARASDDQISQDESRQGVKRKRKMSELPDTQSKRRKSDHQSDSSIDSLISDFSRMYISTPPAACGKMSMKSSNTDDEQDERSQLVNSNEVKAGGFTALSDQSSSSQIEMRQGFKRKAKTSDRSESRESKRKRLDHSSGLESNDDQPGPSVRADNEARAGGSVALSDQSSDSPTETRPSLKRKGKTSDRSESKRKRLEHCSGSDSNADQPGPSVRGNNEARAERSKAPSDQSSGSQIETRQSLKRKRKTSDRSEDKEQKRRRSDRHK
ncbi:hypothetical protein M9458_057649 [Cirrhinus mrigala]|uniref:Dentin sialophosphoprotein-like n=1 Tax=Cirrhinus mrigala TaxID=683832 RepID=A0ABD0MAX4_CIRMR